VACKEGDDAADVRSRLAEADVPWALLVDDAGRPVRWIEESKLTSGDRVGEAMGLSETPVVVELDDVLRDALSDLLSAESRFGAVVDADGVASHALSIDAISHTINSDPSLVPSTAELIALSSEPEE
jgi:osmoprotectant transport system ATP-binding protein